MPTDVSRRYFLQGGMTALSAAAIAVATTTSAHAQSRSTPLLDTIVFGDPTSERAHKLVASNSSTFTGGGLGEPGRVLHPGDPATYWGGKLAFAVATNPSGTTYVTVRLWGDDCDDSSLETASGTESWRLQLFCEGMQVGWQEQGAVDNLDHVDTAPRWPGRFFYHTIPLPERLTTGRNSVRLEIRSMGRIWPYGQNAEQFFYPMTSDSRGIYALYSHAEPYFIPPAGEVQGGAPTPQSQHVVGEEILTAIRTRVARDQTDLLENATPHTLDGWAMQSLAEGYLWSGSPAYQQDRALERVLQAVDGRFLAWRQDPAVLTDSDQQWQGFGRVGLCLALLWQCLGDRLDQPVTGTTKTIANPGFEDGDARPSGWQVPGWGNTNGDWSRDTEVHRSGSASLKLVVHDGGFITVQNSPQTDVVAGRTYTYSAWVRTEGTSGEGAYIDPLFFDASGKLVGTDTKVYATTGTHDWERVNIDLTTPAGASKVELHLRLSEAGAAWFDDIEFTPHSPESPGGDDDTPLRRDAYIQMLQTSRDYWRQHFPHYSNQSQICAIGIYQANRGLRLLAPELALPEEKARSYLYQSIGMEPYAGPEDKDGNPTWPLGHSYLQVSRKGLTRELGYVGSYGEVTDWLVMMYESVTRGYGGQSAPELREHMIAMIKARGYFRNIDVDANGARISRIEAVVGWRNEAYPENPCYAQRTVWDSNPVQAAHVFADPALIGWTQEMEDDNQLWPQLTLLRDHSWTRVGLNALRFVARDLDAYRALAASGERIPTGWDQPDFVFSDEENGVVALKVGQEILYASLYWRARQAVNDYGRVHHLTPTDDRSATVRVQTWGTTDQTFTVRDWTTWDYAINDPAAGHIPPGGFPSSGAQPHQAFAGDVYHLAPVPDDVPDPALGVHFDGVETLLVGRAPFYVCVYGDYLIAMNTSSEATYRVPTRAGRDGFGPARLLGSDRPSVIGAGQKLTVPPLSTIVLKKA